MALEAASIIERANQARPLTVTQPSVARRIGKGEVLVVGLLALAGYTALLLKMPYRAPVAYSLWAALALASVYFYLRLRLDIRMPLKALLCLVISLVIDVIGNQFGLFSQRIAFIPYDIITHFTASALSFVAVMWLLMQIIERYGYRLPLGFIAFFAVTTTFSLAAYYEITELIDERLLGNQRIWSPRDTAQDMTADLAGIILATICYTLIIRRRRLRVNRPQMNTD